MKMEEECTEKKNWNYQYLDTSLAERPMWLIKPPSLVASSFEYLPFPDDSYLPIVTVSVDPQATEDKEAEFVMKIARAESGNIPKRYTLEMSKDFVPMYSYSESSKGEKSVVGKIKNKIDMRPHNENIESYGRLCRERASKYMCKNRQIQVIDNDNGMHMRPMPSMIIPTAATEKKKVTNKASEMKRTRRDRREMEEVMFNLFERQSNWTLRLLIQETDQPEQFLKDLLRDLCFYNNKGSNQGTYELKPEYKKAPQE
ncbi:transcription initiation factor IIF subunit beta isoform X1 [Eutrema salsugineum]|nr:transcription initiation factor IIF subunit beta isoform X1 [Eutrema salsugineum]